MKRSEVYEVIDNERDYQNHKWSPQHMTDGVPADSDKTVAHFIVYMQEYMHRAITEMAGEAGDRGALENLKKVAALAVACFEVHGVVKRGE